MKTVIQIVLVAVIVGGASGAASFFWNQKPAASAKPAADAESSTEAAKSDEQAEMHEKPATDETATAAETSTEEQPASAAADAKTLNATFGPPVAARPPYDPHGDEAGDLINRLRARAAATSRQEVRVSEREEAMQLIFEDLRREQMNSMNVRRRVLDEINHSVSDVDKTRLATEAERVAIRKSMGEAQRIADEELEKLRRENDDAMQSLRREKDDEIQSAENDAKSAREGQDELRKRLDILRKPAEVRDLSGSPEATVNLKKMITVVDTMPPEDTAKILGEMVEKGRTEAVIALLNAMKPRQSAKVLTAITEKQPSLAADLVDRLKRFRKDGADAQK